MKIQTKKFISLFLFLALAMSSFAWDRIPSGGAGSGDVSGPGAAVTDNAIACWDTSSGDDLKECTDGIIPEISSPAASGLTMSVAVNLKLDFNQDIIGIPGSDTILFEVTNNDNTAPILRHQREASGDVRTILGSDQNTDLCFAGDGVSTSDFRNLYGGVNGNPIQHYNGEEQWHYIYYNAGGGGGGTGQFKVIDFDTGIERIITGGGGGDIFSVQFNGQENTQTVELNGMPLVFSRAVQGYDCSSYNGEDEKDTICFQNSKLHVRHGLAGTPVSLEEQGISGPSSSVDNHLVVFDGVTGELLKDSSGVSILVSTIQTTNATVTTAGTFALASGGTAHVRVRIVARDAANDSAVYVRECRAEDIAGTVTVSTVSTPFTSEDVAAWDATLDNSGADIRVRVTGFAATTIDWTVTWEVIEL